MITISSKLHAQPIGESLEEDEAAARRELLLKIRNWFLGLGIPISVIILWMVATLFGRPIATFLWDHSLGWLIGYYAPQSKDVKFIRDKSGFRKIYEFLGEE